MAFPSKGEINKVLKKLKHCEGSLLLPPDASPLERFRFDLCQKFVKHIHHHNLSQKKLADILEIDEAKTSKILRYRIDGFSTDRLILLYLKINPDVKLKVA